MKLDVNKIQKKVQPVANKISNNRYLKAMAEGMMLAFPATMIGALAILIKGLPIEAYQNFITSNGIDKYLQLPITLTTNMLALIFVFCIAYSLAEGFEVKGISVAVVSLISFLIVTPLQASKNLFGMEAAVIPMDWLGATGVFTAIIVAFISARLYVYITKKGWTIKMPESVPPFIKDSFSSLIPGILIVAIFGIISAIFDKTPFGNIHQFIYGIIQLPLQNIGGSFAAMLLVALIGQILWLLGIHGTLVTFSVVLPIWQALDIAQLSAYSSGQPLPNILGFAFFGVCTFTGSILGLAILMLKAKSKRYKTLGKLSIVPAIFGITEPLIFGVPVIMNPVFAIPFVFGPVISLGLGYFLTLIGILPILNGIHAPVGTPMVIQGLISGGWRIALFQVVLIVIWTILWYPFFKVADNKALQEEGEQV